MQIFGGSQPTTPPGWPLPWWACMATGPAAALKFAPIANNVTLMGFVLPVAVTFNKISVPVNIIDAVNLYDWGIYSYAGSLICHVGAQSIPATGVNTQTVTGAPISLNPGKYYFGFTGNTTTAQILVSNPTGGAWSFLFNAAVVAGTGGALPASLTPPADTIVSTLSPTFALST
jgi:hypothetical protein